jgi:hypothetical protein
VPQQHLPVAVLEVQRDTLELQKMHYGSAEDCRSGVPLKEFMSKSNESFLQQVLS